MAKTAQALLDEWFDAQASGFAGAGRKTAAAASQDGGIFSFKDVALAPFRGAEGFLEDAYGLADALTFDVLPDYDLRPGDGTRLLGESETMVGKAVEGISNFAVGFIPVAGWLGRSGKFGNLVDISTSAEQLAKAQRKFGKAFGIQAARGAVAGAATDLIGFGGHEERLSNLIQSVPFLENDVTAFLAADKDDGEIEGRLKNVLEGIGVGALTEPLFWSLKALKRNRSGEEMAAEALGIRKALIESRGPDRPRPALELPDMAPKAQEATGEALEAPPASAVADEAPGAPTLRSAEAEAPLTSESIQPQKPAIGDPRAPVSDDPFQRASQAAREATGEAQEVIGVAKAPKTGPGSEREGILSGFGYDNVTVDALTKMANSQSYFRLSPETWEHASARVNPRNMTSAERLAFGIQKRGLNASHFITPDATIDTFRAMDRLFADQFEKEAPGFASKKITQITDQSIRDIADLLGDGTTPQAIATGLVSQLKDVAEFAERLPSLAMAAKTILVSFGSTVTELGKKFQAGQLDDAGTLQLYELGMTLPDIGAAVKGILASSGRTQRGLRENTYDLMKIPSMAPEVVRESIESLGGPDNLRKAVNAMMVALGEGGVEGTAALARLADVSRKRGFVAWTQEYWYNALLSSARTMVVNFGGGVLMSMYMPIANALGASIQAGIAGAKGNAALSSEFRRIAGREISTIAAFLHDTRDSMADLHRAFKMGMDPMDPKHSLYDTGGWAGQSRMTITAENAGVNPMSTQGRAIDWFGRVIRTPMGLMTASDHFIKKKNVYAMLRSSMLEKAAIDGVPPEAQAEFVQSGIDKMFYQGQLFGPQMLFSKGLDEAKAMGYTLDYQRRDYARNYTTKLLQSDEGKQFSSMAKIAMDRAREVTFTQDLAEGTVGRSIQKLVGQHPMIRFITPFVKTPLNILNFAGQSADLPGIAKYLAGTKLPGNLINLNESKSRFIQDILSNDPRRAAEATGRIAAAAGITSLAFHFAYDGLITGRGPQNPQQRRILLDAGWQDYSFKIGDKYVSYARIDPLATFIGTMADTVDYLRYGDTSDDTIVEQLAMGFGIGVANNLTNKSYLAGLSSFVNAMQDPERRLEGWVERMAGSFVPTALAHGSQATGDGALRDVNSMLEAAMARTPYLSDKVAPYRNVFGEPILQSKMLGVDSIGSIQNIWMPISYREVSDDLVRVELARIGHGIQPPRAKVNGIDLRSFEKNGQTAFDRWGELHGSVRVTGQTLHNAMKRLIQSPAYQKLSPTSVDGLESPRVQQITSLVQKYRQAAYKQLLKEYQDVAALDRQAYLKRRALAAGTDVRSAPGTYTPPPQL